MLGVPPQSNANYAFILTALSKQDKAVFLLPNGVLTTNNKEEQAIKKSLIEKNYLEAVIALPERMFESTSIPTSLLIFNKKKQTSNILMINADSLAKEEIREQRGQVGSKSHTSRVYKKKINVLPNEAIKKIELFLDKPGDEQGVSKVVPIETIKEQGYVLTPNRYIEMKQEDMQHSSLEKLSEELNRVSSEKGAVKLTINRKMANDLGLLPLIKLLQESTETSKELNDAFKDEGVSPEKGAVKLTINRKMANDLGLLPLIKLLQESTETSKELNDAFKDEGVSLNTDSIVTLTNSKTFKIEVKKWDKLLLQESTETSKELNDAFKDEGVSLNTDSIVTLTNSKTFKIEVKKWDKLPDLIVMFAQMWKQVMVHYNNEENRYLMELKDILLDKMFKQI